jgi:hypothetical protein
LFLVFAANKAIPFWRGSLHKEEKEGERESTGVLSKTRCSSCGESDTKTGALLFQGRKKPASYIPGIGVKVIS